MPVASPGTFHGRWEDLTRSWGTLRAYDLLNDPGETSAPGLFGALAWPPLDPTTKALTMTSDFGALTQLGAADVSYSFTHDNADRVDHSDALLFVNRPGGKIIHVGLVLAGIVNWLWFPPPVVIFLSIQGRL